MPKKVRGITGNSQRKKRAEGLRRLRAKESEEERNRRRRRDAERHILARILETPEQAIQRKARDAERHRQKRALETQKRVEEAKLNQAKIKETQDVTVRVKLGKSSLHNCSQKQRNQASELPRLSEALMKHICYNPQGFLMYGNSFGDTITSDVTNQHAEHTRTSLGYYSVLTATGKKDNFTSDLEYMTVDSDSALPTNIENRLIGDDKESESFQCKKEPSSESNSNDASEFNELIPSGKESEVLRCKEKRSVENDSDKEPDSFLESPALTQHASHSPPHTPTVHIDLLIPRRPETYQMNSFMINPTSNSKSYQLQNSKKYEQGARIPVIEKPFSPVIVIKKEISDIEFNSEPQQCSNPEPQHCPNPEPQHCSNPEPQHCSSPELQHCSNPEPQHCSNPKCLESISQLKKKVAGLEFQLKESLKMSGVMSLKVQNVLDDKRELENKLQNAEKEILYYKQKCNVLR